MICFGVWVDGVIHERGALITTLPTKRIFTKDSAEHMKNRLIWKPAPENPVYGRISGEYRVAKWNDRGSTAYFLHHKYELLACKDTFDEIREIAERHNAGLPIEPYCGVDDGN